jgi:glutathione synthase
MKKKNRMRILFVMDPLEHLDPPNDTSLFLLRELFQRGHETWVADSPDLWSDGRIIFADARNVLPKPNHAYECSASSLRSPLTAFDLVLIRKEPPFDANYLYLTYLLEQASDRVPMVNHPRGIRNANEKLAILHFPSWIPETLVTSSAEKILQFQRRLKDDLVLKPLDEKGGKGTVLTRYKDRTAKTIMERSTCRGKKVILAQRMLRGKGIHGEKRIVLLNGQILTAFEKRPPKGDFRANLSLGGTCHPAHLTPQEHKLVRQMRSYLLKEGLLFVGLDVLANRLIEVNVTCPAGLTDAKMLYPQLALAETWADSLEDLAAR